MSEPINTVTISKAEYDRLLKRENWLNCLEAAGVDNWCGYDEARQLRDEDDEESEEDIYGKT